MLDVGRVGSRGILGCSSSCRYMKAVLKVLEPSGVAFLVFCTSLDGFGTIPIKLNIVNKKDMCVFQYELERCVKY